MLRSILRIGAALALTAAPALAQFGAAAPTTGTLASPHTETSAAYAGMAVSWSITAAQNNLLRYAYTFTGFGAPGISHIIFSLSDNCSPNFAACVSGVTVNSVATTDYEFGTFGQQASNPGIINTIFGVKINTPGSIDAQSGVTFSFLSQRVPVYGDIYVKGGRDSYAYNDGLIGPHTSQSGLDYIARPDGIIGGGGGGSVVPEPSTYVLMASGLVGLAGVARRRKQSQA